MGQLEDLKVYVDVINHGGIARAAEYSNIAKSAISRRLKLLEDRYGMQLVDRRPGLWEISPAGRELYQRALQILSEAEAIETDFSHTRQSLKGPLSLSIPREYGLEFLQPFLLEFVQNHPEIQMTVDFDDRRVDLEHENYDLAIRISAQSDPDFMTQSIGVTCHNLYASRTYAAERGLPESVAQLTAHPLLHFGSARRAFWVLEEQGQKKEVEFVPVLNSNSGQFLVEATRQGRGIARLPDFLAKRAFEAGELVQVLPNIKLHNGVISVVYPKSRLINRRMRVFLKEIARLNV